jgi:hypothetical protein
MTEHQRWWWRISVEDRYEMKSETRAFMAWLARIFGGGDCKRGLAAMQFYARMKLAEEAEKREKRAKISEKISKSAPGEG